ncbi:Lrp/AsnC family transcriptional regulator [Candidatus Thorarchaeota archaeon]|nr:MAG: Lrp/AsnC family transcriptional regulator [Candidatus Thorarchaeota archaeon]
MVTTDKIDDNDRKIIKILSSNARTSLRDIKKKVDLSPSSIRNRMERLVSLGFIKRYTVDVDYRKLGYDIQVIALITSKPSESDALCKALSKFDEITEVLRTSGPANFICMVRVQNISELTKFITCDLEKLNGVERIETMFVLPHEE